MIALPPLQTLAGPRRDPTLPLPPELARVYGRLSLAQPTTRPYVIGNAVTTLDGVVSLGVAGHESGGDMSGRNPHDRLVMGLLRALADVIVVGAGTLRVERGAVWTADEIFPDLAAEFRQLRRRRGRTEPPLNVIVSASGQLDLRLRVFASGKVSTMIVTTTRGARRLRRQRVPRSVQIRAPGGGQAIPPRAIRRAVGRASGLILLEGGPRLFGDFFAQRILDEQFPRLASQLAGRDTPSMRPGLVTGRTFAPRDPRWGRLVDLRRGGSHLFLRYAFR
jgi:riboflavin biosynthesis pyrimidine reductase